MTITTLESIPVKKAEAPKEASPGPSPTIQPLPENGGKIRILIVDDERAMRAMTCAIVNSMGFTPVAVGSGEEAINLYREHHEKAEPIQAVVMDLALPGGISGLEATDALREIDKGVKVIASSGYLQQNARTAAIERGFAGILPKPYTAERLTAELRWVLQNREDKQTEE